MSTATETVTDADHAECFISEAILAMQQTPDRHAAESELAEYLAEVFRDIQDLEGVAAAVASGLLPYLQVGTATDAQPRILYRQCEGKGCISVERLNFGKGRTLTTLNVTNEDDCTIACAVISVWGMRMLAAKLNALADQLQGGGE